MDVFLHTITIRTPLSGSFFGGEKIKMKNQKSHHLLIGCSADSSHVSSSSSSSESQAHSVITTEARLISSQKDKWEEWG